MTTKRTKTLAEMTLPLLLIAVLGVVVTIYIAGSVSSTTTSTVTKANRDTFLTPGDDVLSLEEDLKKLKTDPAAAEKAELEAVQ